MCSCRTGFRSHRKRTTTRCAQAANVVRHWEIFEKAFNLIPRETKIYLVPATIPSVDLLWSVEIDLLSTRQQLGVERLFELHAQPTGTFAQKHAEEIAGEFDIYVDDTYVEIDYEAGYEDY